MEPKRIRRKFILIFLGVMLVNSFGSIIALYQSYDTHQARIKEILLRDARITNNVLESIIGDANKLLDVAHPQIIELLNKGALTDQRAYQILHESRRVFNSYIKNDGVLLTIYIDRDGIVRSTNREVLKYHLDVSDRLHFSSLKKTPNQSFVIGNLVIARTTKLPTFHLAMPLVDSKGEFRGTIATQILTKNIESTLDASLDQVQGAQLLSHLQNGCIAYAYPTLVSCDQADISFRSYINRMIAADQRDGGVQSVPPSEFFKSGAYIAFSKSEPYEITTSMSLSKKIVFVEFLKKNKLFISYILIATIVIALVVWLFYRRALLTHNSIKLSFTDELTGLDNRRAFDVKFPILCKDAARSKTFISALFIDIDHFKIFNDNYGHDAGDRTLQAVASVLQNVAKRPLDICCRWGGEEFLVLLPNTDRDGALQMAVHILEGVRRIHLQFGNDSPKISVSVGIATASIEEASQADDLVEKADRAMYAAKQSGRDRYEIFTDQI